MPDAPSLSDLAGLWHRDLLRTADGSEDLTTWVGWLQSHTLYVDLRVPAGRPDFTRCTCLEDLTLEQIDWLATQEGFAGHLLRDEDYFVWQRHIDFQPPGAMPDSGMLEFENGMMVEFGRYSRYVEHWRSASQSRESVAAAVLVDGENGVCGQIVRSGALFMYARSRQVAVPAPTLTQWLQSAPSLNSCRSAIDCEISFGRVSSGSWIIERSTLPFREAMDIAPLAVRGTGLLETSDLTRDGTDIRRRWQIVESEGNIEKLVS